MVRVFTLTLDGISIKFAALNFRQVEHFTAEARSLSDARKKALELNRDAAIDVEPFKKHMLEICCASLNCADSNADWSVDKVKSLDKAFLETLYVHVQEKSRMVPLKDGAEPERGEVRAEPVSPTREA